MICLRKARFLSTTIAVVGILAWITGTNHCLLALMQRGQNAAASMSHCPGHAQESRTAHDGPSGMLACCQGLLSPHFELAKGNIPFLRALIAIQFMAIGHLTLPKAPGSTLLAREYDTGPPGAGFFVGIVLRRSLPENAPPLVS
jgi:hypothetical protein